MFSPCRPPRACRTLAVHNWTAEAADRDSAGPGDLGFDDPEPAGPAALAQPESNMTPSRAATIASRDFGA